MLATASETSVSDPLGASREAISGPELVAAMEAALEDAWERVQQAGAVYCAPRFAAETRTQLSRIIVEGVTSGELHPGRLSDRAVSSLFPLGLHLHDTSPDSEGISGRVVMAPPCEPTEVRQTAGLVESRLPPSRADHQGDGQHGAG